MKTCIFYYRNKNCRYSKTTDYETKIKTFDNNLIKIFIIRIYYTFYPVILILDINYTMKQINPKELANAKTR